MNEKYIFEYLNENDFKQKERSIKKYNMLAYKKLYFEYYPSLREGKALGNLVSSLDGVDKYELTLPTDEMFKKIHGNFCLHYSLYKDKKIILLTNLMPEDILLQSHQKELTTYKGVMISKKNFEKDMFKINLLNMLKTDNQLSNNYKIKTHSTKRKTEKNKKIKKNNIPIKPNKNIEKENKIMIRNHTFEEIKDTIELLINDDIPKIDLSFYKSKFMDWIIIYLLKKECTYSEIRVSFINYIEKNTKDIVILNNLKLLNIDARYDYNVMKWLNELVDEDKINIRKNEYDERISYITNLDKISKNQKIIMNVLDDKTNWFIVWGIIIFVISILSFYVYLNQTYDDKESNTIRVLESYLIDKDLESYNGNIYSKEAIELYVNNLKEYKEENSLYNSLEYLYYLGINDVFTRKNKNDKDDYYIVIDDSYYDWLLEKVKEEYPKKENAKVENIKGDSWCNDKSSLGGILKLDDYTLKYIYNNISYFNKVNVSYYIYYEDLLVKNETITISNYCYTDINLPSILEKYYYENIDLIHQSTLINFKLDDNLKNIVFKNENINLKITNSRPVFSDNYIVLD